MRRAALEQIGIAPASIIQLSCYVPFFKAELSVGSMYTMTSPHRVLLANR